MKKILLSIFVFSSIINAQLSEQIIDDLQKKFAEIYDFEADFTQQLEINGVEQDQLNGKFYYGGSNKFRVEIINKLIISDGEAIWNIDKNQNKIIINRLEDNPSFFSIENFVYDFPEASEIKIMEVGEDGKVVELKSKEEYKSFERIVLTINNENLIDKFVLFDGRGTRVEVDLKNINVNNDLDPKLFDFKIKDGMKVIDLR